LTLSPLLLLPTILLQLSSQTTEGTMARTTRAAAKAQQTDPDFDLEMSSAADSGADALTIALPSTQKPDREPLTSITPNGVDGGEVEKAVDDDMAMKKAKGKGKKHKGKKSKKTKGVTEMHPASPVEPEDEERVDVNGHDGSVDVVAKQPQTVHDEQPRNNKGIWTRLTHCASAFV
jgi:hypothetical protein